MQHEDRVIHFSTELFHQPVNHSIPKLQELYFALSKTKASYESTDFSSKGPLRLYSHKGEKSKSAVLFMPDRLVLIEEWADVALGEFRERVELVVEQAQSIVGIPVIAAQTALVRSTFALTHHNDARVFLMESVCKVREQLPAFGRPLAIGGLRFVLPETPNHRGTLQVVIEPFKGSPNEIFVEVRGVYNAVRLQADSISQAGDNIAAVRQFIAEQVFAFLNGFDVARDSAH